MTVVFGILFGSVASVCSGSPPRANLYELDASSEQRREKPDTNQAFFQISESETFRKWCVEFYQNIVESLEIRRYLG